MDFIYFEVLRKFSLNTMLCSALLIYNLFLLKYSWCSIWCWFKVCKIMIQNYIHCEMPTILSIVTICHKVIRILLTLFPIWYLSSLLFIYFLIVSFCIFSSFIYLSPPPMAITSLFSLFMSLFLFLIVHLFYLSRFQL